MRITLFAFLILPWFVQAQKANNSDSLLNLLVQRHKLVNASKMSKIGRAHV